MNDLRSNSIQLKLFIATWIPMGPSNSPTTVTRFLGSSKHHAQKVLTLLNIYPKRDVLTAMQRAVTYRAFGYSSLERILAQQGTPKPSWQQLSESEQEAIAKLTDSKPIPPRHSQEYQELFYGERGTSSEKPSESPQHEPQEDNQEPGSSGAYCELDCGTIGYFRNEYPLSMEEGIHWLLQSRLSNTKSI